MANTYFKFKQFTVQHNRCAMKVTTDACLFGAWVAEEVHSSKFSVLCPKFMDIGTGTGLLSLMLAQKNEVRIDAIEIDPSAAGQAAENVAASPWKDKISVIHHDVLQWQTSKRYECIISNPPFYENELRSEKQSKNLAHHDEGLKLAGLFRFIQDHLVDDGTFFLLLPAKRTVEAESLFINNDFHQQQKVFVQQTLKHQPFRVLIQGRRQKVERVTERFIAIRNNNAEYTPQFVALLKDYYLHL